MSRSFSASAVLALVAVVALPVTGDAQPARRAASPLQQAARAFNEGRYDEVETLTDKLDAHDANVVALKARAVIARGRYADAESMLRPIANRLPTSEAALQLGLLQQLLGKPDAEAVLTKIAASADTANTAAELARAARALRALDRAQEANAVYRDAVAEAPTDPVINTAWGELYLEKHQPGDALKSFRPALQADPKYVPALLGTAEALAEDNPPEAMLFARQALETNPSSVEAYVFLAQEALD